MAFALAQRLVNTRWGLLVYGYLREEYRKFLESFPDKKKKKKENDKDFSSSKPNSNYPPLYLSPDIVPIFLHFYYLPEHLVIWSSWGNETPYPAAQQQAESEQEPDRQRLTLSDDACTVRHESPPTPDYNPFYQWCVLSEVLYIFQSLLTVKIKLHFISGLKVTSTLQISTC